jgi:hypothetical protein
MILTLGVGSSLSFSGGSSPTRRRAQQPQRRPFMDRHVVCLVARDKVLRLGPRRVMHVALESNVRDHLLENYPANSPRFRVPFDVVAPLERFRQSSAPLYHYLPEIYLGPSRTIDRRRLQCVRGIDGFRAVSGVRQ